MTIIDAIKNSERVRRPIAKHLGSGGNGWISSEYLLSIITPGENRNNIWAFEFQTSYPIDRYDILADDWEIDLNVESSD